MSVRARIEAVIYAAEEPVTLAQLLGVVGEEAGIELDRRRADQGRLALEPRAGDADSIPLPSEPDLLNDEILEIEDEPEDEGVNAESSSAATEENRQAEPAEHAGETSQDSAAEPAILSTKEDDATEETTATTQDALPTAETPRERERAVREYVREQLAHLVREYAAEDRGIEIREVAGGYRFATKPEFHETVRGFARSLKPPLKLSLQALETLAVVAYKQPVTAPEVSEIRGVDSGGVLGSLMARKLVTTAGRKQVIGRPILYRTTKDFLLRFGLKDTSELPSIEEFEKMASELAEPEELPMQTEQSIGAESPHTDPEMLAGMGGGISPGTSLPGDDVVGGGGDGGSVDPAPVPDNLPAQGDVTEPQADGDNRDADEVVVDGRLSGVGVVGTQDTPVDSSAGDAMMRRDEERDA